MRKNHDQPASGSAQEHQKRGEDGCRAILQPARRTAAEQVAHDEPEIEAPRMNQQALEDIRVAAQMRAAHPTRVVEMQLAEPVWSRATSYLILVFKRVSLELLDAFAWLTDR